MGNFEKIKSVWDDIPMYLNLHQGVNAFDYYKKLLGVSDDTDLYANIAAKVRDSALAEGIDNETFQAFGEILDIAYALVTSNMKLTVPMIELLNTAIHIDQLTPLAIYVAFTLGIPEADIAEAVNGGSFIIDAVIDKPASLDLPPYTKFASTYEFFEQLFVKRAFLTSWTKDRELKVARQISPDYVYFSTQEALVNFMSSTLEGVHTDFNNNVLAMLLDRVSRSNFTFNKPMLFINRNAITQEEGVFCVAEDITVKSGSFKDGNLKSKAYAIAGETKSFPAVPYSRAVLKDIFKQEMVVFVL